MTKRKISYDDFMAAMDAAVAERGEGWTYPLVQFDDDGSVLSTDWHNAEGLCRYAKRDGTPACIVGEVLYRLNPDWLPSHRTINSARNVLHRLEDNFIKKDYDRIVEAATVAQSDQDRRMDWGFARTHARERTTE